jgi:hypothetical protein
MSDPIIGWLFRIVLAVLAFCIVFFGLPWLLSLGHIVWPDLIIFLLAILAGLAVLGHYWWGRRAVVV